MPHVDTRAAGLGKNHPGSRGLSVPETVGGDEKRMGILNIVTYTPLLGAAVILFFIRSDNPKMIRYAATIFSSGCARCCCIEPATIRPSAPTCSAHARSCAIALRSRAASARSSGSIPIRW